MAATSIRHMHITMDLQEQLREDFMKRIVSDEAVVYYWHVQRKAARGKNKWIKVNEFCTTKKEMARLWNKFYRGGNFRLRCLLKY